MTIVFIEGSKNDFAFGPDRIEIPDQLVAADEASAVLDVLTWADYPDGIQSSPSPDSPGGEEETPQERAIRHGFTALSYRRDGDKKIRIL